MRVQRGLSWWPKIPLGIVKNQHTIVVNFHQDFEASTHNNFSQGQTDRYLIYWPNHYGEAR